MLQKFPRISAMDISNLIQGTRQFFQGHPVKPKNDDGIQKPSTLFNNQVEAALSVQKSGELSLTKIHSEAKPSYATKEYANPSAIVYEEMHTDAEDVIKNMKTTSINLEEVVPVMVSHQRIYSQTTSTPSSFHLPMTMRFSHSAMLVKEKMSNGASPEHNTSHSVINRLPSVKKLDLVDYPQVIKSHSSSLPEYYSKLNCENIVYQQQAHISDCTAQYPWILAPGSQVVQQGQSYRPRPEEQEILQTYNSVELIQKSDMWKNHLSASKMPEQIPSIAFTTPSIPTVGKTRDFESIAKCQSKHLQPVPYRMNKCSIPVAQRYPEKGCTPDKLNFCSPSETLIGPSFTQSMGVASSREQYSLLPATTSEAVHQGQSFRSRNEEQILRQNSGSACSDYSLSNTFCQPRFSVNCQENAISTKDSPPITNERGVPVNGHRQQFSEKTYVLPDSFHSFNHTSGASTGSIPRSLIQIERSTAGVSLDHLSNRQHLGSGHYNQQRGKAHEQSNQQRIVIRTELSHQHVTVSSQQTSQWNPKIQKMPIIRNNFGENVQDFNTPRSSFEQQSSFFENRTAVSEPRHSSRQNYCGRQPTDLNTSAFDPFNANFGSASLDPSATTLLQLQQPTYSFPKRPASMEAASNFVSEICRLGGSVIQQPINNRVLPIEVEGALKQKEARVSVISNYSSKCNHNQNTTKCVQAQSVQPIQDTFTQPKQQTILVQCNNKQTDLRFQLNRVNVAIVPLKVSRKQSKEPTKSLMRPKQSIEETVKRTPTPDVTPIDPTLDNSDPIVSDEKWEEWKSSFEIEWNAFVKDLTVSENIKRVYR